MILVTYASENGATAGVAHAIGWTLKQCGCGVEVTPVGTVETLAPYQAVIIGSAIQRQAWLPDALAFIDTHRLALRRKPVATFMVCMTLALKSQHLREAADITQWMAPVRRIVQPVSEGYFAGMLDLERIEDKATRRQFALSTKLGLWEEGDHRDWDAIRHWAASLPALIIPQVQAL